MGNADEERLGAVTDALRRAHLAALITTRASNVRMLSGYWPVTGASAAIVTSDAAVGILAPEDEAEFAKQGWAAELRSFQPASLDRLPSFAQTVREPLRQLQGALGIRETSIIGVDHGAAFDPSTYASTFEWGNSLDTLLPQRRRQDSTLLLEKLKAVLTAREIGALREACRVAAESFRETLSEIQPGQTEYQAASRLRTGLNPGPCDGRRYCGFAYCMSGPNAARASAAYQSTGNRTFEPQDAVLLHCNSAFDGLWTDITRTHSLHPDSHREMCAAIEEARLAAIAAVRPGATAASVDLAARRVLESRGFGRQFRHATGHGVGFAAINHNALPRIHPLSGEVLESGMVFNIEPAIYIDGVCGLRHCDMVAVTSTGAEVLTDF